MRQYTVAEYESGWYVETAAKDIEHLRQVAGPFPHKWEADVAASKLELKRKRSPVRESQ